MHACLLLLPCALAYRRALNVVYALQSYVVQQLPPQPSSLEFAQLIEAVAAWGVEQGLCMPGKEVGPLLHSLTACQWATGCKAG